MTGTPASWALYSTKKRSWANAQLLILARCGFPNRDRADVLEILQGNATSGALGHHNERLTDAVVNITTKPRFSACHALESTADIFRAFALHLGVVRRFLQALPTPGIARATGFNLVSAAWCRRSWSRD